MADMPRADTGDSVGRFRRYWSSTLVNYHSNLSMCDTFLQKSIHFPDNRGLLATLKEIYDLNLSAVTLSIWSFRTSTFIFCTQNCTILFCFCSASIPSCPSFSDLGDIQHTLLKSNRRHYAQAIGVDGIHLIPHPPPNLLMNFQSKRFRGLFCEKEGFWFWNSNSGLFEAHEILFDEISVLKHAKALFMETLGLIAKVIVKSEFALLDSENLKSECNFTLTIRRAINKYK